MTRVVLALQALWIVLSRPELPRVVSWPEPFWSGVPRTLQLRFGITRSLPFEMALYAVLVVLLVAAAFGLAERYTCIAAGLLLVHFAPLEEIITGGPLTMFRGLTHSALGLLLVGFASVRVAETRAWQYRWPVAGAQFLMAMTYFGAATSKLHSAGLAWAEAGNIRAIAMTFYTWGVRAPLAPRLIERSWLCAAIAVGTVVMELTFPLVLVSRRAAKVIVPLVFIGHLGIMLTLGIVFLSLPLLLLFIDWEWLAARFARGAATARVSTAPAHRS